MTPPMMTNSLFEYLFFIAAGKVGQKNAVAEPSGVNRMNAKLAHPRIEG